MSLGRAIGHGLLGGIAGGSKAVYEEATESLKDKRERALEMMRNENAINRDDRYMDRRDESDEKQFNRESKRADENYQRTRADELSDAEAKRAHELKLAGMQARSSRTPVAPFSHASFTDPITGETSTRLYNKFTGEFAGNGGQDQNLAALMPDAENYANKKVDEMAGLLSSDASDFARFGGDREQAKSFFVQEYLNMATGKGSQNPTGLLQQKFGQR